MLLLRNSAAKGAKKQSTPLPSTAETPKFEEILPHGFLLQ
jgi:hypothetical protein